MPLEVRRIGESFCAEVAGVDLARPLDDDTWAAIHRAYLEHKVLIFHGQSPTPREFYAFGTRFGRIEPHTVRKYWHPEIPGIVMLSNRVELGRPKGIRDAGSHWHSDWSYREVPANVTMLHAIEIPDEGGDTLFCDLEAAYAELPPDLRAAVDGRWQRIQYRWCRDRSHPEARWNLLSPEEQAATPEVRHPVVRTHPETGRKSLFLFPGITSGVIEIEGLGEAETLRLIERVIAHAAQPRHVFRYRWHGPGDLVLWDNRCTMHHATTDVLPSDKIRTLHRINTVGTVPY